MRQSDFVGQDRIPGHRRSFVVWVILGLTLGLQTLPSGATVFELPTDGSAVIGADTVITTHYEDTLLDIARKYSLGYDEIIRANPGVDMWLPGGGTRIVLPGRRLLAAAISADGGPPTLPEMLLRMRGGGTGALLFTATDAATHPDQSVPSTALSKLLAAAAKFEAGELPPDDEFRRLLEGSSRAGGARPKALVHDESGEWLAKFPSRARDAAYDVVGLEATCLTLARRAGLDVPESRLQMIGARR